MCFGNQKTVISLWFAINSSWFCRCVIRKACITYIRIHALAPTARPNTDKNAWIIPFGSQNLLLMLNARKVAKFCIWKSLLKRFAGIISLIICSFFFGDVSSLFDLTTRRCNARELVKFTFLLESNVVIRCYMPISIHWKFVKRWPEYSYKFCIQNFIHESIQFGWRQLHGQASRG